MTLSEWLATQERGVAHAMARALKISTHHVYGSDPRPVRSLRNAVKIARYTGGAVSVQDLQAQAEEWDRRHRTGGGA